MAVILAVQPSFTVDTAAGTSFGSTSSPVALPGTPASDAFVRVANLGPCHIAVKLGVSNAVVVTPSTGVVILAGEAVFLTLSTNTFIAGVAMGGNSTVNLATGN
jgi:hypothetical protein